MKTKQNKLLTCSSPNCQTAPGASPKTKNKIQSHHQGQWLGPGPGHVSPHWFRPRTIPPQHLCICLGNPSPKCRQAHTLIHQISLKACIGGPSPNQGIYTRTLRPFPSLTATRLYRAFITTRHRMVQSLISSLSSQVSGSRAVLGT